VTLSPVQSAKFSGVR